MQRKENATAAIMLTIANNDILSFQRVRHANNEFIRVRRLQAGQSSWSFELPLYVNRNSSQKRVNRQSLINAIAAEIHQRDHTLIFAIGGCQSSIVDNLRCASREIGELVNHVQNKACLPFPY